ncbi:uncharacterized protein VirK/YbjX [Oxalobacteraceae bacterium GrIS 1.11]
MNGLPSTYSDLTENQMTQLITLRSCLSETPRGMYYVRDIIKLQLRALFNRRQTSDWLHLLNSSPVLGELARACPRLIQKIYRPYFSHTMDCQARLALLSEHYRFIARHGLGPIVAQATRHPVPLAVIEGKSGAVYQIELRAINAMEREGELILQLRCGPSVIYSTAFSFMKAEHRMSVGIGCMQGPTGADSLALVREATRDLHGLRPKNLMLRLVRQLGHDFHCQAVILVGNPNRTVRQAAKKGLVFADYDALWLEMGAHARGDGNFELACEALPAPVMEAIASKKRSEARKRHETLQGIIHAMRASLSTPGTTPLAEIAMPAAPVRGAVTVAGMDRDYTAALA